MWLKLCSSAEQHSNINTLFFNHARNIIMNSNPITVFLTMLLLVVYPLVRGIPTDGFRDMARFVPDNALIYFEQRHGSKALKEFNKSPLGKKISSIKFIETGRKIGLTDPVLHTFEDILSLYSSAKDNKMLHEVFGKRFAATLLPPIDSNQSANLFDFIKDNTIFITKPRQSGEWPPFLDEIYSRYVENYFVSSMQYGNHHIKRLQMNGQILSVVQIEGFFLISHNERQLRRCIDTFDAELPALAKKTDFVKIRKQFDMPDSFIYLPIDDVRNFIAKSAAHLNFPGKSLLLKELATTVGFTNFGYGSWTKKKSVVDKVLVQYNSHQVNEVVKNHIDAEPSLCSMLSITSENPMFFYWSNNIKIKHFLQYFEKSRKDDQSAENFWSTIEEITGKNAEEIFLLLGEEMSLILEPGPKDEFFPLPLGMFFLQVNNVSEIRSILENVIAAYDIPISVKSFGPIDYTYWTPSPQNGLQPLYGFWDDFIFFGNSSSLLQMIVDKNMKNFTLLDNRDIKSIDPGFAEKNNSVSYLNNVELIKLLQKGLDLLAMSLIIEDSEAAVKVRAAIDGVINPLLDGAKMYGKSCTRSYFTPDMVVIDSVTTKSAALMK
jgi:hypothetical protein